MVVVVVLVVAVLYYCLGIHAGIIHACMYMCHYMCECARTYAYTLRSYAGNGRVWSRLAVIHRRRYSRVSATCIGGIRMVVWLECGLWAGVICVCNIFILSMHIFAYLLIVLISRFR